MIQCTQGSYLAISYIYTQNYICFYKGHLKTCSIKCLSVSIRVVGHQQSLISLWQIRDHLHSPLPGKQEPCFGFGLTGRPGSLPCLSSWTCSVTLYHGHSLSPTLAQGQVMAEWPMPVLQPHLSPVSLQSMVLWLSCWVLWWFDPGCTSSIHPPKTPSTFAQGRENTTKCSSLRDRESSLTSYCYGQNRL